MSLPDPIIETLPYRPNTTYAPVTVTSGDEPLTKRERFAMAAMQGVCGSQNWNGNIADTAKDAVTLADALIAALNSTPEPK
jgi:hypothetical protein